MELHTIENKSIEQIENNELNQEHSLLYTFILLFIENVFFVANSFVIAEFYFPVI